MELVKHRSPLRSFRAATSALLLGAFLPAMSSPGFAQSPHAMVLRAADDLRERLDLTGVTIPSQAQGNVPRASSFSGRDFIITSQRAAGFEIPTEIPDAGNLNQGFATRIGTTNYLVDPVDGRVMVDDTRGYRADFSMALSDENAVMRADPILSSVGANGSERITRVVRLMRDSATLDGRETRSEQLATKVVVKRVVGGVPVDGERLILSFALDGSLRKISGRWHGSSAAINVLRRVDESDVVEAAIEAVRLVIAEEDLVLDADSLVRVHTFARFVEVEGGSTPVLVGRVELPLVGAGGRIYTGVDFPLNEFGAIR